MAELVRVFHSVSVDEAQALVDNLVERRVPLVWQDEQMKRVLDPGVKPKYQVLVLMASSAARVSVEELLRWTDTPTSKRGYFLRLLRQLHRERLIELDADEAGARLLPPGSKEVHEFMADRSIR
jgi:hypothetical protein